jgi:glutathione S-transferase
MSLKLFIDHASQPSRAVWTVCKFGKFDIELKELRIIKNEHLSEEVLKINPLRKLPFILDNDFYLAESHSIMKYIFETRKDMFKHNIYPCDLKQRAMVDEYLDWHHTNTRKTTHYIASLMYRNAEGADELLKVMEKALETIDGYFLGKGLFINGSEGITLADISCFCELEQLRLIGYDLGKYGNVKSWQDRVGQFEEIYESHKLFYKLAENYRAKHAKY